MKKTVALVIGLALLTLLAIAAEVPEGSEELKFEAKIGTVTFAHAHHATIAECTDCHHMWDGAEGTTPQKCSECHMAKEEKDGAPKLMDAVHQNCGDCHQAKRDAGEKAGPLTEMKAKECKDCHVRG